MPLQSGGGPNLGNPMQGLGDMLAQQVGSETEEQRKRRLLAERNQQLNAPLSAAMGLNTRPGAMSSVFGGAY